MKIHEIGKEDDFYQQARNLRYSLFFEAYDLPENILDDEKEPLSSHVAMSEGALLIGYGRLTRLDATTFQVSQMVIAPEHQSSGYGSMLLKELIERAVSSGARTVILNARATAARFYEKQGFTREGELFHSSSTGVPHVRMVYRT